MFTRVGFTVACLPCCTCYVSATNSASQPCPEMHAFPSSHNLKVPAKMYSICRRSPLYSTHTNKPLPRGHDTHERNSSYMEKEHNIQEVGENGRERKEKRRAACPRNRKKICYNIRQEKNVLRMRQKRKCCKASSFSALFCLASAAKLHAGDVLPSKKCKATENGIDR